MTLSLLLVLRSCGSGTGVGGPMAPTSCYSASREDGLDSQDTLARPQVRRNACEIWRKELRHEKLRHNPRLADSDCRLPTWTRMWGRVVGWVASRSAGGHGVARGGKNGCRASSG